jgi:hypothetical protein
LSLPELQELLDEWLIAAMVEVAGYVPVALSADDYIDLVPARWQVINAYGIKVSHRTYDSQEPNPFRQQPTGAGVLPIVRRLLLPQPGNRFEHDVGGAGSPCLGRSTIASKASGACR